MGTVTELGDFLRARRESVTPAEVGLPAGPRRRTPGLRRAEVATLAGVSVDYLTRIEQGRDRRPSPQVLGALADAMRFTAEDRAQLRMLQLREKDPALCPGIQEGPEREISPAIRAVLDRLDPAVALNRIGDILAHTSTYDRLARPIGLLTDGNVVRHVFTNPAARHAFPDWDRMADRHVAQLKGDNHHTSPHAAELAGDLAITAGAPFADRYRALTELPTRAGTERWRHPDAGDLTLTYETLTFPESDGLRIVTYLPADDPTAEALARLTHPAPLRLVRSAGQ